MRAESYTMENAEDLRKRWTHLYKDYLPALAKARDPVQQAWPVHLDHCFARIVLDNAVGVDRPWTKVVRQPAVNYMSAAQMKEAVMLAEKLASGEADLGVLNERSLHFRGKKRKANYAESESKSPKKQKQGTSTISLYFLPSLESPRRSAPGRVHSNAASIIVEDGDADKESPKSRDMTAELRKIADSDLTPFRKQMLGLLCQIPPGYYSTYQAMSDYITETSHKTCARAVGNAMRNNPFAPEVPCHRVLAADGTLGGFGGHWGEHGKFANKKHELLHAEGVRFDSRGKVKGPPFRDFHF